MAKTYEDVYTKVYNIIWEKTTATVLDIDTVVKPMINSVEEQICEGLVHNIIKDKPITAWDLRFLMKTVGKNLVTQRELTADAASGDTTLYFDTTDYDTSGYILLAWGIVTHTGKTATTVSWVSWVDVAITTGTASAIVRQAYLIPTTAVDTIVVKDVTNGMDIPYIDYRDDRKFWRYYSIYPNNETSDRSFLVFFGTGEEQIRLIYQNGYTALVDDDDESNLPDDNGTEVTARIVAWLCMIDTNYDYKRGIEILKIGYGNLERMYSKYARINKDFKKKIQTKQYSSY